MPTTSVRLRWLVALLAAISLLMPHLIPLNSQHLPLEGAQVVLLQATTGDAGDTGANVPDPGVLADSAAELGDSYSSDYPHEVDKILSLFSFHWDAAVAAWTGVYFAVLAPDPVFALERPPKAFLPRA